TPCPAFPLFGRSKASLAFFFGKSNLGHGTVKVNSYGVNKLSHVGHKLCFYQRMATVYSQELPAEHDKRKGVAQLFRGFKKAMC
ncbi:hypothetical protein, partial [Campylobacter jejuni]|uniref:hypothetical protein n=1 Tax=Campylobacter jejuni TaxID=197 RepID=UPI002F96DA01